MRYGVHCGCGFGVLSMSQAMVAFGGEPTSDCCQLSAFVVKRGHILLHHLTFCTLFSCSHLKPVLHRRRHHHCACAPLCFYLSFSNEAKNMRTRHNHHHTPPLSFAAPHVRRLPVHPKAHLPRRCAHRLLRGLCQRPQNQGASRNRGHNKNSLLSPKLQLSIF
jgi:hypothetical protein